MGLVLIPPMLGRRSPLTTGRPADRRTGPDRRRLRASSRGESPVRLEPGTVPTGAYDRVVRIVSWVFILATTDDRRGDRPVARDPGRDLRAPRRRRPVRPRVHDLLPPNSLGTAKFIIEGSVAITFATLLVLLTGAQDSPFFFTFPLIVGGAALVVSPAGHVRPGVDRQPRLHLRDVASRREGPVDPVTVAKVGINLTALVLLAYVATVIAREQRRARDAAVRLSTVDPLTGLFNRTFFFAAVDREIARSLRSTRGFCLLMMDLDELKTINDRYGHYFGDQVLRGVGEVIRSGVRKIDTAARYGGDEFVVLLPETDPTGAWVLAEKVRIGVTELDVDRRRQRAIPASISVGVVSFPDDGQTSDQLMISADQAMYASKRGGKNRGHEPPGGGRRRLEAVGVASSGHAGPRATTEPGLLDPGDPGGPPPADGSTSARRRSRSTRPSRSPATTPPSSATVLTGQRPGYAYGRIDNPTTAALARAVAELEGAEDGLAFATGMAAIHAALVSLVSAGDRIVATTASYGTTRAQLAGVLTRLGVTTEFVDVTDLAAVERALTAAPARVLYAETIANPTIVVADHAALAELAHRHGARYVVDNTFASPYLCRPAELGADLVVESATKYLAGHSDVLAGVVSGRHELVEAIRSVQVDTGRHARAALRVPRAARPLDARDPDGPPRGDRGGTRGVARASGGRDPRLPPVARRATPSATSPRASSGPAAGCSPSSSRAAARPAGRSSTRCRCRS